jgi:hypothetical protein
LPEAMLAAAQKAKAIAGKDLANPLASILSTAMMLRHSLGVEDAARLVERAERRVLAEGYRTGDTMEPGATRVGTEAMGDAVAAAVTALKAWPSGILVRVERAARHRHVGYQHAAGLRLGHEQRAAFRPAVAEIRR